MDEKLIDEILKRIKTTIMNGNEDFSAFNSPHEGYAILLKSVDEMWDDIKKDYIQNSAFECVNVGVIAVKYIASMRMRDFCNLSI